MVAVMDGTMKSKHFEKITVKLANMEFVVKKSEYCRDPLRT